MTSSLQQPGFFNKVLVPSRDPWLLGLSWRIQNGNMVEIKYQGIQSMFLKQRVEKFEEYFWLEWLDYNSSNIFNNNGRKFDMVYNSLSLWFRASILFENWGYRGPWFENWRFCESCVKNLRCCGPKLQQTVLHRSLYFWIFTTFGKCPRLYLIFLYIIGYDNISWRPHYSIPKSGVVTPPTSPPGLCCEFFANLFPWSLSIWGWSPQPFVSLFHKCLKSTLFNCGFVLGGVLPSDVVLLKWCYINIQIQWQVLMRHVKLPFLLKPCIVRVFIKERLTYCYAVFQPRNPAVSRIMLT